MLMLTVLLASAPLVSTQEAAQLLEFHGGVRPTSAAQLIGGDGHQMVAEGESPGGWTFEAGVLTASPGWDSVFTPEPYQDFRMHVEFAVNRSVDDNLEARGNSGVYIQERYEVQILDSFERPWSEYAAWDCGSLYRLRKPSQPASWPSEAWQSYDILFRAARFEVPTGSDGTGPSKTEDARITVFHNGRLIHDDFALPRKTGAGKPEGPEARPIKLQGHHNQVRFRNTWIEHLELEAMPAVAADDPRRTQKTLPRPGTTLRINGRTAFVIEPPMEARLEGPTPWVWYAPTLRPYPGQAEGWMIDRFLAAGVAIAGIDAGESYGSPTGQLVFETLHEHLTVVRRYAARPALLGRSRGGLMALSWAAAHPERVAGIGGIYPVCDLTSYPGLERAAPAFGLTPASLAELLPDFNPVDRLAPLAAAEVPILFLHGDQDQTVPLEANSGELARRYEALGGTINLRVFEGRGHDMWKGWFQSAELTEFLIECALAGAAPVAPGDEAAPDEPESGR